MLAQNPPIKAQAALLSHRRQDEQLPIVKLATADRGYVAKQKSRVKEEEKRLRGRDV